MNIAAWIFFAIGLVCALVASLLWFGRGQDVGAQLISVIGILLFGGAGLGSLFVALFLWGLSPSAASKAKPPEI